MNAESPALAAAVEPVLEELDGARRRAGVLPVDRAEMRADIALDLEAAASDGVDPRLMVRPSIVGFAEEVADARGVRRVRAEYARTCLGAFVGALVAFVVGGPLPAPE